MASADTPLWLEIKTEYIDANLDKVIQYLSKGSAMSGDSFYQETVKLLSRRIRELIDSMAESKICEDNTGTADGKIVNLRLLGAYLLIQESWTDSLTHEAFFYFIKTLVEILPDEYTESLTETAINCLLCDTVTNPGFGWTDISTDNFMPNVLAHKLLQSVKFSDRKCPDTWFQDKGSIRINNGFIEISSLNRSDAQFARCSSSLPLLNEKVVVLSPPSERIKQSEENDIEVMDTFTVNYLRDQGKTIPSPSRRLKTYSPGETMPVCYLGKDFLGNLLVETAEKDHVKIKGQIPFSSNAFRNIYKASDIAKYLRKGDIFDAEYKGGSRNTFDLTRTFTYAIVNNCIRTGTELNAVLKNINAKGLMTWWTEDGYPAYVAPEKNPGTYSTGDAAILMIDARSNDGYVYASISEESYQPVDEDESRSYCVTYCFLYPEDTVFPDEPAEHILSRALVKGLCRLFFNYQRSISQAAERFRILCVCRILATLTQDSETLEYINVLASYLKDLVHFANGQLGKIRPLSPEGSLSAMPAIRRREEIVRILMAYGTDADSEYLSSVIHSPEADQIVVQLAKLVQSCNRIDDVYPAIKIVIKREITRFLAVETEDNTDFEETSGPNLGVENIRTEFKTSFFFAPANAKEQNQEKTIFRSLCSFLNSQEGGSLYLGVNDCGGINGLDSDLEYLEKKIVGTYKGIDGYVRYITDRAKEYFDLDVRLHFRIEPAYDGKVVIIMVEPYRYGVVEFEGIPYIRNNSESVKMSQTLRRQIESRRLYADKEMSANIVSLKEAIKEERQVILHGYSSSHSGEIRDRHVEPFCFIGNCSFIWCYDLDDSQNKLFRLSRIGNVQILLQKWTEKEKHEKGKTDIFHFTGDTPIPIKLELDMLAKNILTEEYPDSAKEIIPAGDGHWLLDTSVYSIYGIGRFYTGLAGHTRIIDAPELAAYAKEYFAESLKHLDTGETF